MIIVKVPGINGLGKTKGCRNAGNAIFNELKEIYSSEKSKAIKPENYELEEIHVNNNNLEEQNKLIYENSVELFEKQDFVYFLGGDHSISYPICKAFLEKFKEDSCLIVFDSHPDCMPAGKEPSHEEWLRALVEEGFPTENILLVGIRNIDTEEAEFIKEKKIKTIKMNDLLLNLEDVTDTIMEFASGKKLYLSIDIDFIDPAFAPSTGYPEPGGASSREAMYIFSRLSLLKNLKALDIVEVNSEDDKTRATVRLAGKILAEFL